MTSEKDLKHNESGALDLTAYEAIRKADKEAARFYKLLYTIFNICELSGFNLEGRITVKDKRTGKIWK